MSLPETLYIEDIVGDELFVIDRVHYITMKSRFEDGTGTIDIELDAAKVDQLIDWLTAWKAKQ